MSYLTENWSLGGTPGQALEADAAKLKLCVKCEAAPPVAETKLCSVCSAPTEQQKRDSHLLSQFMKLSGMAPLPDKANAAKLSEGFTLGIVSPQFLGVDRPAVEDAQQDKDNAPDEDDDFVTYDKLKTGIGDKADKLKAKKKGADADDDSEEDDSEDDASDEQEESVQAESMDDDEADSDEPTEDDLTTEDHSEFYQYGKKVLTVDPDASDKEMWDAIYKHMKKSNFFPNVWFISDHGNAHLMSPPKGYRPKVKLEGRDEEVRYAMSSAELSEGAAYAIGTKRKWKGGTFVKQHDGSWKPDATRLVSRTLKSMGVHAGNIKQHAKDPKFRKHADKLMGKGWETHAPFKIPASPAEKKAAANYHKPAATAAEKDLLVKMGKTLGYGPGGVKGALKRHRALKSRSSVAADFVPAVPGRSHAGRGDLGTKEHEAAVRDLGVIYADGNIPDGDEAASNKAYSTRKLNAVGKHALHVDAWADAMHRAVPHGYNGFNAKKVHRALAPFADKIRVTPGRHLSPVAFIEGDSETLKQIAKIAPKRLKADEVDIHEPGYEMKDYGYDGPDKPKPGDPGYADWSPPVIKKFNKQILRLWWD